MKVVAERSSGVEWEKEFSIGYDQIFRVEILSTYCERFSNDMRSQVPRF